jgi:hypothetical protein
MIMPFIKLPIRGITGMKGVSFQMIQLTYKNLKKLSSNWMQQFTDWKA